MEKITKFWLELGGASEKNGLYPCPLTGLLVGTWAVTVDGRSGIPPGWLVIVICLINVVVGVGVASYGVALSVGISLETEGKMVELVVVKGKYSGVSLSTGIALEKRTLKPIMLRAQTESCMISLCIKKENPRLTLLLACGSCGRNIYTLFYLVLWKGRPTNSIVFYPPMYLYQFP